MIIKLVHDNQLFVDDRCNLAFAKKPKKTQNYLHDQDYYTVKCSSLQGQNMLLKSCQ